MSNGFGSQSPKEAAQQEARQVLFHQLEGCSQVEFRSYDRLEVMTWLVCILYSFYVFPFFISMFSLIFVKHILYCSYPIFLMVCALILCDMFNNFIFKNEISYFILCVFVPFI